MNPGATTLPLASIVRRAAQRRLLDGDDRAAVDADVGGAVVAALGVHHPAVGDHEVVDVLVGRLGRCLVDRGHRGGVPADDAAVGGVRRGGVGLAARGRPAPEGRRGWRPRSPARSAPGGGQATRGRFGHRSESSPVGVRSGHRSLGRAAMATWAPAIATSPVVHCPGHRTRRGTVARAIYGAAAGPGRCRGEPRGQRHLRAREQAVRRRDGGRRPRPRDRRRRVHGPPRPVGLWEDDGAADDRRARDDQRRQAAHRRRRRERRRAGEAGHLDGVPELRALSRT